MFNKVILIGRLGQNAEAKTAHNNKEYVILNVATQESWKNDKGDYEMQKEPLPLDVDTHVPSYMAECRQRLEDNLTTVAAKAREKTLPDVTLADGELRIAPLRKNAPESAEEFAEKAYALVPHVRIT